MYLNERVGVTGYQPIISLVPSQTELLHYLGLEKEVIAITKFCVHPTEWFKNKIKVGGTKTIDVEKIKALQPSLIIANIEENVKSQVEALSDFPVWLTDVNNLDDSLKMIADVGSITGTSEKATILIKSIQEKFSLLNKPVRPVNVAYLIWKEPYMTIGGDTFIHDMLTRTGMRNVFKHKLRYPQLTVEEIKDSGCELLLLSSEPFPFQQKHVDNLSNLLPGVQIKIVDGEMFSWYGSRLLKAAVYFKKLQSESH